MRLGRTTIRPFESNDGGYIGADARGYQFLLDYRSAGVPFRSFSLQQLLSGEIPPEAVRGKIVLIGVASASVKDFFYTPLSRGLHETQQTPGIVLHGHIVNQLMRFGLDGDAPITPLREGQEILWILLWGIAGGGIGYRIRGAWLISLAAGCGLAVLTLTAYLVFLYRIWIPVVPPALSFSIAAVISMAYMASQEKRERLLLMQLFSRHVSKEIADSIWQQREQFLNGGRPRSQKLTTTVFFSDLRGFSSLAEKMDPENLMEWLNTYMEAMTRQIMAHGGVIDDYAGDGIKANFGVPLPRSSEEEIRKDAVNAVRCALAMEKDVQALNDQWKRKGLPPAGIRIGIFTGQVGSTQPRC
jgi:adenylate cyclase